MNVAKNWALAIMSIALTFAHFSSRANCCWKSEWLSLLKKTFTNAGHVDAKLIDFSEICQRKTQRNRSFLLIVSWRSFPSKFPVKSADFPKNLPQKIFRNLTFFRQNPAKWLIFLQICPWKSREILPFFPRNIRSPVFTIWLCDVLKWVILLL